MADVYVSLGSNLGDRLGFIKNALKELEKISDRFIKISSIYETEPFFNKNQPWEPWFLNCCLVLKTGLQPEEFLRLCQAIENKLGRVRKRKFEPRVIDIDLLFYDSVILEGEDIKLPHPEIQNRRFVLVPLAEIASDIVHPQLKKTVKQLLNECVDASIVKREPSHTDDHK